MIEELLVTWNQKQLPGGSDGNLTGLWWIPMHKCIAILDNLEIHISKPHLKLI